MTTNALAVSISDIRSAITVVLDDLESRRGSNVDVHVDYFWSVPPDAIYDMSEQPPELTVGQISELTERIRAISTGEMPPIDLSLIWLGDVMRALALDPIVTPQI